MNRTSRLEKIEQTLIDHPDGLRVIDLSKICGVDRRTIYRDLQTIQKKGIPIWQSNGRFGIERKQYMTSLRLNLNEAFAILWAIRVLNHHADQTSPHVRALSQKISDAFPPELAQQIETIYAASQPSDKSERTASVIENLTRGWADSLKVMIWYNSQSQRKALRRVIAPYVLDTTAQGRLFVIGVDDHSREVRIYAVSRITRAEVLADDPFRRPQHFDLSMYIDAANEMHEKTYEETVVLRFRPEVATSVNEHKWRNGQKFLNPEDGSAIFVAEVTDWHEMEQWVRSWGAQVEVLAPAEFRRTIADEFRQAVSLYG
jgi:proteasome accessory factor B